MGRIVVLLLCLGACGPWASAGDSPPARTPAAAIAGSPLPSLPLTSILLESAFAAVNRDDLSFAGRLLSLLLDQGQFLDGWTRGQALRCRALVASRQGRLGDASAALIGAEEAFSAAGAEPQLALVWRLRAGLAYQQNDRALAQALAERALALLEARRDDEGIVAALAVLARVRDAGPKADEALERALQIARDKGLRKDHARLLHDRGDRAFGRGDFAGATLNYEEAEAVYLALDDSEGLGRVWTSLGRLNRAHGRHREALACFERARDVLERTDDRLGVIQATNAVATALENLDRSEEAGREYERALRLAEESKVDRVINFQRGNLGGHYLNRNQYARANPLLRESAARESDPTIKAIRLGQLGIALRNSGESEAALQPLTEAITGLRALGNRERLFGSLAERAMAYRSLARLDEALADVRASLETLEEVRRQLAPSDFLRRGFHQYTLSHTSLGIGILIDAGRAQEALEAGEQARARAFLDLLAARPALAARTAADAASPASPTPDGRTTRPGDRLLLTRDREGSTRPALPSATADNETRATHVATFEEIAAEAHRRRTTVLNYWVDTGHTYVWVVRPDGTMRHAVVDVADQRLVALTRALWAGLGQRDSPAPDTTALQQWRGRGTVDAAEVAAPAVAGAPLSPRRAARELYRLLIAPIAASLPSVGATLTVVPHGPLFRLSFAALLDDADRYLVERYAIAYAPSVSVLSFTRELADRRPATADRYLFVADPLPLPAAPGDPESLPPLPGTLDEVRQVVSRVPASPITTLTGRMASESAVTDAMAAASVIHLATHGIVRDDDPFGSFLALGADGIGPAHDGALTAEEIYGLRLQARLVVLSACRSGLGEVSADGIVGLTRAFFFAGTPSVVATLWDVADGPSARLLRDFYAARARGQDLARALRTAQLAMLASLRAGGVTGTGAPGTRLPERPVFWAAFVLVGEP